MSTRLIAGVIVASAALSVHAENYVWTGAEDAFWTNAANWKVGAEVAANPPGEYLVFDAGSGSTFVTNGVVGDTAIFGAETAKNTTIDLDGQWKINSVVITKGEGDSQAFTFGTKFGTTRTDEQAQYLKINSTGCITIEESVTTDQTIQGLAVLRDVPSPSSTYISLTNNSATAKLIWKANRRLTRAGNISSLDSSFWTWPNYHFYGPGTFWQDGPTSYDAVYYYINHGTGKIISGETNGGDTGYRVWGYQYPASSVAGVREIEIPQDRFIHGVTGGHKEYQIETAVDLRVYGDGYISAQKHYNTTIDWSANFYAWSGKTLDIQCGIRPCAPYYLGNLGAWGPGTTFINTTNNLCVGDVRVNQDGVLKAKKLGMMSDEPGTSSLGGAKNVLFFWGYGTLAYGGNGDETTDRNIVATNSSDGLITIENLSPDGILKIKSAFKQAAETSATFVRKLQFKATTQPIVFDGSFEEGKNWKIQVAGAGRVSFAKVPKAGEVEVPVAIENGGILEVSDLSVLPNNLSVVSGTGSVVMMEGVDYEFDTVPNITSGTLNYVIPDGVNVTFTGETSRRLLNVQVNGVAAKLVNGKLVASDGGDVCTWIKSGLEEEYVGNWDDIANWKDGGVPLAGERAFITPPPHLTSTNVLTINVDKPVTLKHLRLFDSPKVSKVKITGKGSLTVAAGTTKTGGDHYGDHPSYGGIWAVTNTAVNGRGDLHTTSFPDIDVPITVQDGEAYFNWSSANGWTLDPSQKPSIHAITKDFNKNNSWMHFAGRDGWLSFREGAGTYKANTYLQGYVELYGTNQFTRLGTGTISLTTWWLSAQEGCWGATPLLLCSLKPGESYGKMVNNISWDLFAGAGSTSGTGPYYAGLILQSEEAAMSLAVTNRLEFTGAIYGGKGDKWGAGIMNSYGKNTAEKEARFLSPDTSRVVFSGNSQVLTNSVNGMRVVGMVEIASTHALGKDNSQELVCGCNGYWTSQQPAGINGVLVRPGITYNGPISSQPVISDGNACGMAPYMVVGAAQAGDGEAVFNSAITESTADGYTPSPLRFHAPKGSTARFNGKITTAVATENAATVLAEGDVVLANANNSFARGVKVRSGRLILANDTAADTKEINLGDLVRVVPGFETVVAMDDGRATLAHPAGWNWWSLNEVIGGVTEWYLGTWLHMKDNKRDQIDGVTVANNQKVLINTPQKYVINGFYNAVSDGYQRPWSHKRYVDYKNLYGAKFKVQKGERYGGRTYFFAVDVDATTLGTGNMASDLGIAARSLAFHEEPTDADVAVMAEGERTIANAIKVSNNYSAGKSTIGGVTAGTNPTFSGDVTLERNVTLEGPANGKVAFTGTITGDGDVIGEGAGTVDLTSATLQLSNTNCIALAGGTLKLTTGQVDDNQLKWIRRGEGTADSTGVLVVNGNLDLTNAKFENFALIDDPTQEHEIKIAEATGGITLPTRSINKRWRLVQREGSVYAKAQIPGLMIMVK